MNFRPTLPCPFCGADKAPRLASSQELMPELEDLDDGSEVTYTICCDANVGGCGACSGYQPTEANAVDAWDSRVIRGTTP